MTSRRFRFFLIGTLMACALNSRAQSGWEQTTDHFWRLFWMDGTEQADSIKIYVGKLASISAKDFPKPHRRYYLAELYRAKYLYHFAEKPEEAKQILHQIYQEAHQLSDTSYNVLKAHLYSDLFLLVYTDSLQKDPALSLARDFLNYESKVTSADEYYSSLLMIAKEADTRYGRMVADEFYRQLKDKRAEADGEQVSEAIWLVDSLVRKYTQGSPVGLIEMVHLRPGEEIDFPAADSLRNHFESQNDAWSALQYAIWSYALSLPKESNGTKEHFNSTDALIQSLARFEGVRQDSIAMDLYRVQLQGFKPINRSDSLNFLMHMGRLADVLPEADKAESLRLWTEVTQTLGQLSATSDLNYLNALSSLAFEYRLNEKEDSAFLTMRKVVDLSEKLFGKDSEVNLRFRRSYGSLCINEGRLDDALTTLHSVYDAYQANKAHIRNFDLAGLCDGLAVAYGYKDQPAKEIYWFEKANESILAVSDSSSIPLYNYYRIFFCYLDMKDWKKVSRYLKAMEDRAEGEDPGTILVHARFQYFLQQNKMSEATALLPAYLAAFEKEYAYAEDWVSWNNLHGSYIQAAEIYLSRGEADSLRSVIDKIADIQNSRGEKGESNYLLGKYYLLKNVRDSAIYHHQENVNTGTRDQKLGILTRQMSLAGAHAHFNEKETADTIMRKALRDIISYTIRNMAGFSEKERQVYMETLTKEMHKYLNLHRQLPRSGEREIAAYDLLIKAKGLLLQSSSFLKRSIEASTDEKIKTLYDQLLAARKALTRAYTLQKDTDSLLNRIGMLERSLSENSAVYENYLKQADEGYDEIKNGLRSKEAIVEFISFPYYDGKQFYDSVLYGAFVITSSDSAPAYIALSSDREISKFISLQETALSRGVASSRRGSADNGFRSLYQLIWLPIQDHLQQATRIYISPDGLLHKVSFAALVDDQNTYLSDKYELRSILSGKSRETQEESLADRSIVLFGGSNYSVKPSPGGVAGNRSLPNDLAGKRPWQDLPGTQAEVDSIRKLAGIANWVAKIFTRGQASEMKFKTAVEQERPGVIHVATHGFYFPGSETDTAYRVSDEPLLRTGIVFSGANHAWMGNTVKDNEEDGILTALELSHLDLSQTRLAVLSACETGMGRIVTGEGVFGLQRALKIAGVKKMIVSLWPVPDKETAEMMKVFYAHLFQSGDISGSFQSAQRYMRNKYPSAPALWAAFTLIE